MTYSDIAFLSDLEEIINDRLTNPSEESYTTQLALAGTKRMAQKVAEEGVEVALAAAAGDRDEVVDAWYTRCLPASISVAISESRN